MDLLGLFSNNLLPVFLAAGAGYAVAARLRIDPRHLAHVAFFVFAPCFIFDLILHSDVGGEALLRMFGFGLLGQTGLAALTWLVARWLGWSRPLTTAAILVVLLTNAGNFGLPVALFAFGEAGLAQAGLYFVTSAIISYTFGVFVASLGRASLRSALAGLPRVPTIWAVALALVITHYGWRLPLPLDRTVGLLGDACIPAFLVILGMQLHGTGLRGPWGPLSFAVAMRLLGGAAVALLLAPLFGLEGTARQAGILQSAMPSAIISIILATEYDVEPAFVTSAVFASTLLSPLTLTPLLAYLGA